MILPSVRTYRVQPKKTRGIFGPTFSSIATMVAQSLHRVQPTDGQVQTALAATSDVDVDCGDWLLQVRLSAPRLTPSLVLGYVGVVHHPRDERLTMTGVCGAISGAVISRREIVRLSAGSSPVGFGVVLPCDEDGDLLSGEPT